MASIRTCNDTINCTKIKWFDIRAKKRNKFERIKNNKIKKQKHIEMSDLINWFEFFKRKLGAPPNRHFVDCETRVIDFKSVFVPLKQRSNCCLYVKRIFLVRRARYLGQITHRRSHIYALNEAQKKHDRGKITKTHKLESESEQITSILSIGRYSCFPMSVLRFWICVSFVELVSTDDDAIGIIHYVMCAVIVHIAGAYVRRRRR